VSTIVSPTAEVVPAGTWRSDPVHSHVSFEVVHAGVDVFRGSFEDFDVSIADGIVEGSVKVASVDVRDEQLNGHLQSPDFFDAQRFPEITFRADRLEWGEITIKGVTRPVELKTALSGPSTDPFGRERIGLSVEATIDRTEFGITWNAPNQSGGDYLANDVVLIARLALVRQEA
jgi:polyisoprenoid-binding protein YceI